MRKNRKDIERELGERVGRDFLMAQALQHLGIEKLEKLSPLLDKIFSVSWYAWQRPLYIQRWRVGSARGVKGLHPIADVLGTSLTFYLECILETLSFAQAVLGDQWFESHPIYIERLSQSEHFDNALFELEMLALFRQSDFDLIPNYRTRGRRDVEALLSREGSQFLLECKSLGESEETRRIENLISELIMGPSGWFRCEDASVDICWPHFPTEDDVLAVAKVLESWQPGQKVSKINGRYSIKIIPGASDHNLSYPDPMDDRARESLHRVLPKLKNTKHPCLVILKCSIAAGLASCRRTVTECLESPKFNRINQVVMIHKRKKDIIPRDLKAWDSVNHRPGFDYDVWNIETSKPLRKAKYGVCFSAGRFELMPPS